jgi:hypothetical protein
MHYGIVESIFAQIELLYFWELYGISIAFAIRSFDRSYRCKGIPECFYLTWLFALYGQDLILSTFVFAVGVPPQEYDCALRAVGT